MSRVLLGRATRCVGAAAAAAAFLCCAGPSLGKSSAGADSEALGVSGVLAPGSAPLLGLPGTVLRATARAAAGRGCADENASVRTASPSALRSAVRCLIDRFRSRGGLPPLRQQAQLNAAAQGHDNQMVLARYFGHTGIGGSTPASRISASGFRWGAYGEAIATGFTTPRAAVSAWLRSAVHCRILLSPAYRYIGLGVNRRPIRGWAGSAGTWTADLALPLGSASPSRSWGLADGCPY